MKQSFHPIMILMLLAGCKSSPSQPGSDPLANGPDSLLVPIDSSGIQYAVDTSDSEFRIMSYIVHYLGYTSTAETLVVRESTWMPGSGGGVIDPAGSRAWWVCSLLPDCDSTMVGDFIQRNLSPMSVCDSISVPSPVFYGNPWATNYDSVYAIHTGYSRRVLSFSRVGFSKNHLRAMIHVDENLRYDAIGRFFFLEQIEGSWMIVFRLSNYIS